MRTHEDECPECPVDTITELATKFSQASANHDIRVALTALQAFQSALLAQVPPDFRQELARRIKKNVRLILPHANAIAAKECNVALH
jgi:hypothetical protein